MVTIQPIPEQFPHRTPTSFELHDLSGFFIGEKYGKNQAKWWACPEIWLDFGPKSNQLITCGCAWICIDIIIVKLGCRALFFWAKIFKQYLSLSTSKHRKDQPPKKYDKGKGSQAQCIDIYCILLGSGFENKKSETRL